MKSTITLLSLVLTFTAVITGCKELNSEPILQPEPKAEGSHVPKGNLSPITLAEKQRRLTQFWGEFQEAARNRDFEWVAAKSALPMEHYRNRRDLIESLEFAFPDSVRESVTHTSFDQLDRRTDNDGEYWRFHYDNGVTSEGQYCVDYDFRFIGRRVRFFSILGAG